MGRGSWRQEVGAGAVSRSQSLSTKGRAGNRDSFPRSEVADRKDVEGETGVQNPAPLLLDKEPEGFIPGLCRGMRWTFELLLHCKYCTIKNLVLEVLLLADFS